MTQSDYINLGMAIFSVLSIIVSAIFKSRVSALTKFLEDTLKFLEEKDRKPEDLSQIITDLRIILGKYDRK